MFKANNPALHWFVRIWEGLVESAQIKSIQERRPSRILNIILLFFLFWGIVIEVQNSLDQNREYGNNIIIMTLVLLGLAYDLNRRKGKIIPAATLTLGAFTAAIFASALNQYGSDADGSSVLYYLIVVILMGEFFLPMRGYMLTIIIVLTGVFGFTQLHPAAGNIFSFLFVFCAIITFTSYNRRTMEREQVQSAGKVHRKQSLLSDEKRLNAQLSLLEEVGRHITESFDEKEILQRTLEAVVDKFGYAEAAISLLVSDNIVEVTAISGTQDFGYRPGYQQTLGDGIIGHVAETHKHHVSGDVSRDPYYYSTAKRDGSALGVPMLDKGSLIGVIYVETTTRNYFQSDDIQTLQALANLVATSLQKARLYARTQEHLQVMTTLQSVSQAVASSLDLDEILHNVIKLLKDTFGYTYLSVYLLEDDILHLGAQLGYPNSLVIREIPIMAGVTGQAVRTKQTQFLPDVTKDRSFLRASYEIQSEICVPLLKHNNVLGVLNVESNSSVPLDDNDVDLLNALAGTIAVAIDNARLHAQVKTMAMTDAVSGLYNRHAFEEFLSTEIQRANRYGHSLSLIIFDVDSFKEYNDTWGHPAGDKRLRAIAELIRSNQRKHDIAARYGGDEFAIILPNTNEEGVEQFAKRLREAARASTTELATDGHSVSGYTLSMGYATYPKDGDTLETILQAADQAELTAKKLGKNRIVPANQLKNP